MIKENFLIKGICQEHFFFQNFRNSFGFLWNNNFHPFFERLPFSEHNEEVVFAYFIECLNFIKPFLYRDEFNRLWINKFRDSFARECIVVNNVIFYNLGVRNDFHVVMIIGIFSDHVNKLLGCKFFLTNHFEKCSHLSVLYRNIVFRILLYWRKGWLWLDIVAWHRHFNRRSSSHWRVRIFDGFSVLI